MRLIGEMLEAAAKQRPEGLALVFEQTVLTFNKLNESVDRLTAGLIKLGIQKNDRVTQPCG